MRRRHLLPLLAAVLLVPTSDATAQSSQFGVRGLGHPGRALSARALGTSGALGHFDGQSSVNPAAPWSLSLATTAITSAQGWRTSTNAGGTGSARDNRFPQFLVGGPIPSTPLSIAISYSTFADRDFTLVTTGTDAPRGEPVAVTDTLVSEGGINDLRMALAWGISPTLQVGVGVHALTGANRMASRRVWADSTFLSPRQTAELDYTGFGLSAGVILRPVSGVALAGSIRRDGTLTVRRDSAETGEVTLPWTLSAGARAALGSRLDVAAQVTTRDWSTASPGLEAQGAIGARNTIEASAGLEYARNPRNRDHLPVRVGVRAAQLPFLLAEGTQPRELAVSVGTSLRFASNSAGVDLALERFRRTQGNDFRETGWTFSLGFSVRTGQSGGLR